MSPHGEATMPRPELLMLHKTCQDLVDGFAGSYNVPAPSRILNKAQSPLLTGGGSHVN